MTRDHAEFEREVLRVVRVWLGDKRMAGYQIFHRIELEGEFPNTAVVIEHSTQMDPTRQTVRYRIWADEFAGEDAESIGVLIMTWALGG